MPFELQGHRSAANSHPRDFIRASEIPGVLSISFPLEPDLRVRRVVTRSRARRTYKCPSWKMDRMIHAESQNEVVATRLYDLDPAVSSFHEQALVIRYRFEDELRSHIPDFVVRRGEAVEIDEIKDEIDQQDQELKQRTDILTPLLAQLGLKYRVRFVNKRAQETNVQLMRRLLWLGHSEISTIEREQADRLFLKRSEISWGEINGGALGERGLQIAARLVLEGSIHLGNGSGPLSADSSLSVSRNQKSYPDLWAA